MGLFLSEWAYFLSTENTANFTKTCFFKRGCTLLRKYAYIYEITSIYYMVLRIFITMQSYRSYITFLGRTL